MNCAGARRLFGAYWDDEITLAERDWLESHFHACAPCRAEYEEFARSLELVGSLPRVEARPDLAERALARARRAPGAPDRLPIGAPRWVPVTATAALLAIAATLTLQWMGVSPYRRGAEPARVADVAVPDATPPAAARLVTGPGEGAVAGRVGAPDAGVPDSLFDHSADIEFILDPVVLHKGRVHTPLKLNPSVQGEKAIITF